MIWTLRWSSGVFCHSGGIVWLLVSFYSNDWPTVQYYAHLTATSKINKLIDINYLFESILFYCVRRDHERHATVQEYLNIDLSSFRPFFLSFFLLFFFLSLWRIVFASWGTCPTTCTRRFQELRSFRTPQLFRVPTLRALRGRRKMTLAASEEKRPKVSIEYLIRFIISSMFCHW